MEMKSKQKKFSINTMIFNWWHKNKIRDVNTVLSRTGSPEIFREMSYEYDENGVLESQISNPYLSKPVSTFNTKINDFGLVEESRVEAEGIDRTSSYQYDDKGRFLISTTNPLGQTATSTYNEIQGLVASQTGIDGLTTNYEYDGFGRVIKSTTPDGIETTIDRSWNLSGPTTRYDELTQRSGSPTLKTTYDIFGRVLSTKRDGFNEAIFTETTYDVFGNIKTTNLPHYQSDPTVVTTYNYDSRFKSRLIERKEFSRNVRVPI